MSRALLIGLVVATLFASPTPALAGTSATPAQAVMQTHPATYIVSNEPGVMPEGIAVTPDGTMYVTSFATGAVYRGDVRRPRLTPFLPAGRDGRTQAAGIHVDRYGRIFVAGYATATLFVYDRAGRLLTARTAPDPGAALNDLAITADAVYVTDSQTGVVWRAALSGRRIGDLVAWIDATAFPVAPSYLNGIVTTVDGRVALVADQGTEALFRIDLRGRTVTRVALIGGTFGADGMLLEGDRLYGTVNFATDAGGVDFAVRVLSLSADLSVGVVVAESGAVSQDQSPTTLARDGRRLLWVNSQFVSAAPSPPFTVTEVPAIG
jgi:sugar lactone lactonase YvrE